jgi:hypothetical protein
MWKGGAVTSRNFPGDTEENHENFSQNSRFPNTILKHYRYANLLDG